MKKVLFLMFLLFLCLGTASVKAQVRIGGDGAPHAAAVLDLNANNDAIPAGNKGALALPRVALTSTTMQLNGATPITGMLVYNTNAAMTNGTGVGMYFWDGSTWIRVAPYIAPLPREVKWILALDTTLTITIPASSYATASSPTTLGGDACLFINATRIGIAIAGSIRIANLDLTAYPSTTYRIKCYRPTM